MQVTRQLSVEGLVLAVRDWPPLLAYGHGQILTNSWYKGLVALVHQLPVGR